MRRDSSERLGTSLIWRIVAVEPAFGAQRAAEKGDLGIVGVAREIEQHAVRPEILDRVRIDVLDRGIGAAVEQRDPVIVGADVHAPLVDADLGRPLDGGLVLGGGRECRVVVKSPQAVHISAPRRPSDWSGECTGRG